LHTISSDFEGNEALAVATVTEGLENIALTMSIKYGPKLIHYIPSHKYENSS